MKFLVDKGVSSWKIRKIGVSPKRIDEISRGETSNKKGRKLKFDDSHRDYVISLEKSDPRITKRNS